MPRTFKVPAGVSFPATLADFKLALAGEKHKRTTVARPTTMAPPYDELAASWRANGIPEAPGGKPDVAEPEEEVSEDVDA